jgi:predicted methyltransferase
MLALIKIDRPAARGVARDFSPAMLESARERFAVDRSASIVSHDLARLLSDLGVCDRVVSGFAIYHLPHPATRALYAEVFALLAPGGVFCNPDHVASPPMGLHERFLRAIDVESVARCGDAA